MVAWRRAGCARGRCAPGVVVILRGVVLVAAGLVLAGCANDTLPPLNAGFAAPGAGARGGAAVAGYASSAQDHEAVPRKTLASKVLAAIALERVTGRKPDPSRLTE